MKKYFLILLLLSLFIGNAFADSISDYTVPANVPLNQKLTIYGEYSEGNELLCAFYIFDTEDQNQVIIRLSDEYTFSDGSFYSEIQLTEPLFRRGFDYNAVTKCGSAEIGQVFYVEQKEDVAFGITPASMRMDFRWWIDPENSLTVFLLMLSMLVVASVAFGFWADVSRTTS